MGKRRGRGEGLIHKRADGRWEARVSLGWAAGKRIRKSVYGETREAVARKLNETTHAQAHGLPILNERQTVGEFLDRWLSDSVKGSVRPLTFESYRTYVRVHIKPGLGKIPLARLTPQHVQAFLNSRRDERGQEGKPRFAPRTVQLMHAVLRRALGQAERWGLVGRNVAKLVEPPRVRHHEVIPFDVSQAKALLKTAKGASRPWWRSPPRSVFGKVRHWASAGRASTSRRGRSPSGSPCRGSTGRSSWSK